MVDRLGCDPAFSHPCRVGQLLDPVVSHLASGQCVALDVLGWGYVDGDRFAHLAWDRRVSFLAVRGTCGFDGAESTDLVHRSGSATRLESLWALSVSD